MVSAHAFYLGFAPDLAISELKLVLNQVPERTHDRVAVISNTDINPSEIQQKLGGTIKIAQLITQLPSDSQEDFQSAVLNLFNQESYLKMLALAEWGRDHRQPYSLQKLKNFLKDNDIKIKFREGPRGGLSGAVLAHHNITELVVLFWHDHWWLGKTVSVSNPDFWSSRDRLRPFAEHKRGMLPPKVARMMCNIGTHSSAIKNGCVIDPFCGTGTILMEARSLGYTTIGGDEDLQAINGSKQNLIWQSERETNLPNYSLIHASASHFTPPINTQVTSIVTEPFLGKQTPRPEEVGNIIKGLEKMYWGSFRNWAKWLTSGASVCIIFPDFSNIGGSTQAFAPLIDKMSLLGYINSSESWDYSHSDAVVKRRIHCFSFKKTE